MAKPDPVADKAYAEMQRKVAEAKAKAAADGAKGWNRPAK